MPVSRRLEVKRTLVLEFSLPGASAQSVSSNGNLNDRQLKETYNERWVIHVNQDNAADTANVFEELARTIRETAL